MSLAQGHALEPAHMVWLALPGQLSSSGLPGLSFLKEMNETLLPASSLQGDSRIVMTQGAKVCESTLETGNTRVSHSMTSSCEMMLKKKPNLHSF